MSSLLKFIQILIANRSEIESVIGIVRSLLPKKTPRAVEKAPGFDLSDDDKVVIPVIITPPVPVQPTESPKLAALNLGIMWAFNADGSQRSAEDVASILEGKSALGWNCNIRLDSTPIDQFKNELVPAPGADGSGVLVDWHLRWVDPSGVQVGTCSILHPDTVQNNGVPVGLGTGVYDKTFGYDLKMIFGIPQEGTHPDGTKFVTYKPLSGRYRCFVLCQIGSVKSNEIQIPVD